MTIPKKREISGMRLLPATGMPLRVERFSARIVREAQTWLQLLRRTVRFWMAKSPTLVPLFRAPIRFS